MSSHDPYGRGGSENSYQHSRSNFDPDHFLTPQAVASLPPPGLGGPTQPVFSPSPPPTLLRAGDQLSTNARSPLFLSFISSTSQIIRSVKPPPALYRPLTSSPSISSTNTSTSTNISTTGTANAINNTPAKQNSFPATFGRSISFTTCNNDWNDASASRTTQLPTVNCSSATLQPPLVHQFGSNTALANGERVLMCLDLSNIHPQRQPPTELQPKPLIRLEYPWYQTAQQEQQQQQQYNQNVGACSSNSNTGMYQQQFRLKRRMFDASSSASPLFVTATPPQTTAFFADTDADILQPTIPYYPTVIAPDASIGLESLEERLRRERQRLSGGSLTQFSWAWASVTRSHTSEPSSTLSSVLRLLIPARGSLFIQDGVGEASILNFTYDPDSVFAASSTPARCLHDKAVSGVAAVDPQLSPDASMVAWTADGEIYVKSATASCSDPAIRITYGSVHTEEISISHGIADFVAQEEMDRYRGFWWHPDSNGILLTRVDESKVPLFRIMHHQEPDSSSASAFEDHRYPFAGKENPSVKLGFVKVNKDSVLAHTASTSSSLSASMRAAHTDADVECDPHSYQYHHAVVTPVAAEVAADCWNNSTWFDPPREATEYLARVHWLPDGSALAQWQNRAQTVSVLYRMDLVRRKGRTLLIERSDVWINLHHMFHILPRAIHPNECSALESNIPLLPYPLPSGSFSFLFASERSGYSHLYLYTFAPEINSEQAILLKAVSVGDWMVEHILGVDMEKDVVFVTGTYDSVLERHLYALPIRNHLDKEQAMSNEDLSSNLQSSSAASPNGVRRGLSKVMNALSGKNRPARSRSSSNQSDCQARPIRLTQSTGMHSIVMDDECRYFVDTSSDLDRPPLVRVYTLPDFFHFSTVEAQHISMTPFLTLYDALQDDKSLTCMQNTSCNGIGNNGGTCSMMESLPPPEMVSFPTSEGTETLYAALYRPDPRVYGPGPYPLICAVYGGPHVQRVNRSWSQCADMRAQRLRSLGFCVIKCDNRGSSRRGLKFESAISRRLGRIEVLDQVAAVRQLTMRGIADSNRVGVYGWSYGGYLSAMCLCRAPDVFHVAVAGAPVTSWDGYDTHYTERYMGTPTENVAGYRESAVFDHVPNMRGKLMIVHGLIDENVHFRHTARLVSKLTAAGKDYDLLIFPDERHSPRRFRDRVYMEERVSDYFVQHLSTSLLSAIDLVDSMNQGNMQQFRTMAGHL